MDISNLKRSQDKVESGDWVDGIPQMGELRLKVRGIGSKVYKTLFERKQRAVPAKERLRDGSIPDDILHKLRGESLFETILLDWDGLTDNGKPFPYDKELALKFLTEMEYEDFHYATMWAAGVVGKENKDLTDDSRKNS